MAHLNPDGGAPPEAVFMDERLAKIRTQIHSKLDNQKHLALILAAVEENMDEHKTTRTLVAYVVSFLALLDQAVAGDRIADAGVATAAAYFLDVALPCAPPPLLRQKFAALLTKLAPVLTSGGADAALVRAALGALETLLLAQDAQLWQAAGHVSPRRALAGMLDLAFDARPKVRKRAQDAVHTVLLRPPASPAPGHAAAGLCADVAATRLAALVAAPPARKGGAKDTNAAAIHALQLVAAITSANAWPAAHADRLCDLLLAAARTLDQYMVAAAFAAFDGLFSAMVHAVDAPRAARVLDVLLDLRPPVADAHLAAAWLAAVASGFQAYARVAPAAALRRLEALVPLVAAFLAAEAKDIYISAAQCLVAVVSAGVPAEGGLADVSGGHASDAADLAAVDAAAGFLARFIEHDLLAIKYQHATREVLEVATAAVARLGARANPGFLGVLATVGLWRSNELDGFPHNKEAEDLIAACVAAMGPEVVLATLPLNLTGGAAGPGRAWMLPLLRDHVRGASLAYYQLNILPLADVFAAKAHAAGAKDSVHGKIFQTIEDQVWALLPPFCNLPHDLPAAFSDDFAARVADLLYSRVDLRVVLCNALRVLAESNVAHAANTAPLAQLRLSPAAAAHNVAVLAAKASNILAVLFNVFSSTMPDTRSFVVETINVYLQIIPQDDLQLTFDKVCGLLKKALDDEAHDSAPPKKDAPPRLSVTMMDLVVTMAKYVPATSYNALFAIFASTVAMELNAPMQKRAFRVISRLSEADAGVPAIALFVADIQRVFVDTTHSTHTSARAARLAAMLCVVSALPATDLHFIPAVLQEVIMSTKDVNERSREAAYGLLIQMGRKMQQGGSIDNSKVPGFAPDAAPSDASLTSFFTMVSAGLAAQSPHMISATITAVSCIVYEFKDDLPQDVLLELASTVELFLTHNSREIAKSAIGFVKVEVLSLPDDFIRLNLPEMLGKLMRWSHEHKNHFKSKVKHIIERLIRKFGIDAVELAIPEEDRKLVANIKKSKARAKKRDAAEDITEGKTAKQFMSAYEEAVYDSDSESDDEPENAPTKGSRNKASDKFILDTGDEPLNLLDRQTLAHISSSKPKKFTKKDVKKHDVEMKNGKIVFKEMVKANDDPLNLGSGIDAYLDAVKQAPVRGQKNKLKFKKSKDEEEWSDSEDDKPAPRQAQKGKYSQKSGVSKPKQKFKARKKL
ncbi:NUC173-domain-containing protein [Metschnikowia bicuspidata var. bicuspidata NRRL YB-4993]|uniref:NUC173-domain-containing protein n=1 Tax=Metschnikowia bicuspidata var. bicuspidata NRRL YB-4993 TaxID=869754 RepID=A0A1A0HIK1_9ASCO|nr:NUC173-domain-containing protein [Metschnikowia bicuspidata var. bicuspidata NRRL YB-4993]OBA23712.1 NUC173-domain-containing protein [Metschnikowia bicuspidata var. bicuspidata NRRL YB-4993]